jgi:hypothetical protein
VQEKAAYAVTTQLASLVATVPEDHPALRQLWKAAIVADTHWRQLRADRIAAEQFAPDPGD